MDRHSVERVSGICRMRKALTRQHAAADGLLIRLGGLPLGQEPNLALKDYWEEPNSIPSLYFLDSSNKNRNLAKH